MDEPQKRDANWKKPDTKGMIPFMWNIQINKSIETESRLVVSRS